MTNHTCSTPKPTPRMLTPQDVERTYGVSRQTLANRRVQKLGPAFVRSPMGFIFYEAADVEAWLAERNAK